MCDIARRVVPELRRAAGEVPLPHQRLSISTLLGISFFVQTVISRRVPLNSRASTKAVARLRAGPLRDGRARPRDLSSTQEARMSDSIPVHGTCDPRFTKVKDLFQQSFDSGEEIGAAVSFVLDGACVVD